MASASLLPFLLSLVLAPSIQGVINRTKARAAGRVGPALMQPYRDLWKLARKGAVYSETTSWIFKAGPVAGLAAVACTAALIPFGGFLALARFAGDLIAAAYLLGLARFFAILAALDTGSSFEGMGASREAIFAALTEPVLLVALAAIVRLTGKTSLTEALGAISIQLWMRSAPALCLAVGALLIVYLAENARIPIDDPTTHLELTMIHEVMVLDHSGPDLALIQYAGALKMWLFGAIIVAIVCPWHGADPWFDALLGLGGIFMLAIVTGLIESSMARLRLLRIPQLLIVAMILAALAVVLAQG